jgi:imidazolonepropionase
VASFSHPSATRNAARAGAAVSRGAVSRGAPDWDCVLLGADLATMRAGAGAYGALRDAALAIKGERIAWIGSALEARSRLAGQSVPTLDATGLWITPGLIDCHTHLIYGGNRAAEFEQRLLGASYEQIARAGGGIQATVDATRAASNEALLAEGLIRARRLSAEGVTTLEIKSGYGLDLDTEARLLGVARELGGRLPLSIRTTFLGLHALPREFAQRRQAFVDTVSGPWLEAIAAAGLADAVDAFCDSIAFSAQETEQFLRAAQALQLPIHLHAGQLSDIGAVQLAARYDALSADHLEYLDQQSIDALAASGTVAVLLPGAFYTLRQTQPPPVSQLRQAGVAMAVSSDSNPGTAPGTSLLLMLNMACTLFGLTAEEALAGVTRVAAQALGLLSDRGTLEIGKRADLALWRIRQPAELCYGMGSNPCVGIAQAGIVHDWRELQPRSAEVLLGPIGEELP